ncbi:MAG: serine--tRNA ligase, partial [Vulcanimicrobiaceae bacterium]
MQELALLRRDPERVRRIAARRPAGAAYVDEVLALDERLRAARTRSERLRAEKNALTQTIARASDRTAEAARLRPDLEALERAIAQAQSEIPALEAEIDGLLADVPNLLDASVPDGAGPDDNLLVRDSGPPPARAFAPLPHWETGERLGILDFERAAKLSGSRFAVLRGVAARLERALAAFFLDRARERGYLEIAPPLLVSRETMWATGQLSKFADAMYHDPESELFLIPTAEVPL